MKKYGRKWRVQNNNVNVAKTPKRDLVQEQREREVRKNPWTPQDIEVRRIKAESVLKECAHYIDLVHQTYEYEKNNPKTNLSDWPFIFIWTETHYHLKKFKPLGERLRYYYISFIDDINTIFEIAKKEHTAEQIFEHLTVGKYDLEKGSFKEFGKRYIDVI